MRCTLTSESESGTILLPTLGCQKYMITSICKAGAKSAILALIAELQTSMKAASEQRTSADHTCCKGQPRDSMFLGDHSATHSHRTSHIRYALMQGCFLDRSNSSSDNVSVVEMENESH